MTYYLMEGHGNDEGYLLVVTFNKPNLLYIIRKVLKFAKLDDSIDYEYYLEEGECIYEHNFKNFKCLYKSSSLKKVLERGMLEVL